MPLFIRLAPLFFSFLPHTHDSAQSHFLVIVELVKVFFSASIRGLSQWQQLFSFVFVKGKSKENERMKGGSKGGKKKEKLAEDGGRGIFKNQGEEKKF